MDSRLLAVSGTTYELGNALPGFGEGFYRGFAGGEEVLLHVAPATQADLAALRDEARLLEKLNSPAVARLCDRGRSDEYCFLVLNSAGEQSLATVVNEAELSLRSALDIIVQVAAILEGLHMQGIAWGRLRPHAFGVNRRGELRLVNLHGAGTPMPPQGITLAEAAYLAPELSSGQPPTFASDLYAFGVLAYELLAGQPPFVGATTADLAMKHVTAPPPDLRQVRPAVPEQLALLVAHCMQKQPAARPGSMALLRTELTTLHQQVVADEEGRKVQCPRCQARVLPADRCPHCQAQLVAPPPPPKKRRLTPVTMITAGILAFTLVCALLAMLAPPAEEEAVAATTTEATAVANTETTPIPTVQPTVAPTATARPRESGRVVAMAGDVPDPNIDLISARVSVQQASITAEMELVGQLGEGQEPRTYQFFFDVDGTDKGDRSTPWASLGADYTAIFRGGDPSAMVLRWADGTWERVGAASATISGGQLLLRIPAEWLPQTEDIRYGVLTINATANLSDVLPARNDAAAAAIVERE
ncbi:MAG: serine/threonine protein kinase [Chloroflexaceae bacterium]|jgi:hypothetical protein|nr:serine/threonine protein kinase [Chloroflexaceae bacterium]